MILCTKNKVFKSEDDIRPADKSGGRESFAGSWRIEDSCHKRVECRLRLMLHMIPHSIHSDNSAERSHGMQPRTQKPPQRQNRPGAPKTLQSTVCMSAEYNVYDTHSMHSAPTRTSNL
jgi:hypothetical protein